MDLNKKKFQSQQSVAHIRDATIRLMAMNGYGKTSISDISNLTGFTKGALYHHYANKEQILESTVNFIADHIREKLMNADREGDSVNRLTYLFEAFADLYENNSDYILIISSLVLELESEKESFAQPLVKLLSDLSRFIERIIIRGQTAREINSDLDAKLLSLNIIGMLIGNTIPWMLNKDRTNYLVILESQKQILLASLQIHH